MRPRHKLCGARNELKASMNELNQERIDKLLTNHNCEWMFNSPHASHTGGIWERQIGTVRRVLEAMYVQLGKPQFTHDLLATLMAEVCAIVNARPITTYLLMLTTHNHLVPVCY